MTSLRERLESHPIKNLKAEIRKVRKDIKVSGKKKSELVEIMVKFKKDFDYIKKFEKSAPAPKKGKAPEHLKKFQFKKTGRTAEQALKEPAKAKLSPEEIAEKEINRIHLATPPLLLPNTDKNAKKILDFMKKIAVKDKFSREDDYTFVNLEGGNISFRIDGGVEEIEFGKIYSWLKEILKEKNKKRKGQFKGLPTQKFETMLEKILPPYYHTYLEMVGFLTQTKFQKRILTAKIFKK